MLFLLSHRAKTRHIRSTYLAIKQLMYHPVDSFEICTKKISLREILLKENEKQRGLELSFSVISPLNSVLEAY